MDGDGVAHTGAMPSEQVLRWVVGVVGGMRVVSVENPSRSTDRRRGWMPTTPLLDRADERVRSHRVPAAVSVFVHGDVWGGNMLWEGDRCVALIDWKTAGVGDPGVDLGSLRMQMALQYGQDAPAHVLEGWQRQAGRSATAVPYWDAVAALNTPTVMHGWPGFADDGSPLDAAAVTERLDAGGRCSRPRVSGHSPEGARSTKRGL